MGPLQKRILPVFFGLLLVSSIAIAAPEYTLSASPSMNIPDQTTTYQGSEYAVDSITRIFSGDSVSVSTNGPSNGTYDINLRGPDNQIVSSHSKTGESSHTFDYFGAGEAGTYAVTIRDNNELQSVHPVVLAGYEISVNSSDSVTAGDSATVTATVSERAVEKHSSLDYVELVVGTDEVQVQKQMEKQDDGTYTTTVSTNDLEPATYDMYLTVRGEAEVRRRPEFLAVSDQRTLTVVAPTTETAEDGGSDSPQSGGAGDTEQTQTATPHTTSTETTATPTDTMTEVNSATVTRTERTETGTQSTETLTESQSEHVSHSPTASPQSSEILEPVTSRTETVTAGSGPGFTVGLALLAILLSIALGTSRN